MFCIIFDIIPLWIIQFLFVIIGKLHHYVHVALTIILTTTTTTTTTTTITTTTKKYFRYSAKSRDNVLKGETEFGDRSLSHKSEVCIRSFQQQQQQQQQQHHHQQQQQPFMRQTYCIFLFCLKDEIKGFFRVTFFYENTFFLWTEESTKNDVTQVLILLVFSTIVMLFYS